MTKRLLFVLVLAAAALPAADTYTEVPLWSNGAPGSEGKTGKEMVEAPNKEHNYLKVWNIHNPSLTVFLPPAGQATGAAVVVAPGGGHRFLAMDHEGYNVGKYLNSIGVAAFVLKYRLAREEGSTYKVEEHALADALRAVRTVRSRAKEWGVDPNRVGIMGFSAGGAVAALASTRYNSGEGESGDAIDRLSGRPDFQILVYPGIRADTLSITTDTPQAFLVCAEDDLRPSITLGELYLAMKRAGVPVEIHVFASGGHGFGIRENPTRPSVVASTWYLRVKDWMGDRGLLRKP